MISYHVTEWHDVLELDILEQIDMASDLPGTVSVGAIESRCYDGPSFDTNSGGTLFNAHHGQAFHEALVGFFGCILSNATKLHQGNKVSTHQDHGNDVKLKIVQ